MKIRLLENVRTPAVSGTRGEIVDVEAKLAEHLERHGQAAYLPRETKQRATKPADPVEETKVDADLTGATAGDETGDGSEEEGKPDTKKGKGKR